MTFKSYTMPIKIKTLENIILLFKWFSKYNEKASGNGGLQFNYWFESGGILIWAIYPGRIRLLL